MGELQVYESSSKTVSVLDYVDDLELVLSSPPRVYV